MRHREKAASCESSTRAQRRVLVVDDEDLIRRLYVRALDRRYEADGAASGTEALSLLEASNYDVVVSDVALPDLNGIELLKKAHEQDADLPVVLVTGAPHVETAIEAVDYGAFRYLVKPVDLNELRRTVDKAVQRRELARFRDQAMTLLGERHRQQSVRTALEEQFGLALDGLYMLYQPIVHAESGEVFAYEALVRSHNPELSHPAALIDAAERLGQVWMLGRRVRARVAYDMGFMSGVEKVFVNVHPAELLDDALYEETAALAPFAHRVVLEITERARLAKIKDLEARVERLRRLGFRLAIDDLGSGYSGLTSVVSLEPSFVKVDMSLVRDIETKPKTQRLLQSILDLGREIGLDVILEGVETLEERSALLNLGAELLQGYLFGRPAPFDLPSTFDVVPSNAGLSPASLTLAQAPGQ